MRQPEKIFVKRRLNHPRKSNIEIFICLLFLANILINFIFWKCIQGVIVESDIHTSLLYHFGNNTFETVCKWCLKPLLDRAKDNQTEGFYCMHDRWNAFLKSFNLCLISCEPIQMTPRYFTRIFCI